MLQEPENDLKLQLKLLRESIWGVEDKLQIILDDIADHEVELHRLKLTIIPVARRLGIPNPYKKKQAKQKPRRKRK